MAGSDHTRKYTVADIEKYVSGQMTSAEMYALEKEMQDDPFLAEAVEGYMIMPTAPVPMQELSGMLAAKNISATVVPIRRNRNWLAAAAAVLILLAVGVAWYWLNPVADESLAKVDQKEKLEPKQAYEPISERGTEDIKSVPDETMERAAKAKGDQTEKNSKPIVAPAPSQPSSLSPASAELAIEEAVEEKSAANITSTQERKETLSKIPPAAKARQAPQHIATYILGGTVTDSAHNPLPFVNIAVENANVNTYSDAGGRFRIISGDSILNARVKSVGYEEQTVALASRQTNKVQLKAATADLGALVTTGYGTKKKTKNIQQQSQDDVVAENEEEPWAEPRDGWGYYDIYLQNNQRLMSFRGSIVDLSFMITPTGYMYDFKVEHSNCPPCSREAVRLIKEGPAWKLYNTKSPYRASVSLQF